MRAPFPDPHRVRLRGWLPLGATVLAATLLLSAPASSHAEGLGRIEGRVVNGTSGGENPAGLEVFLHVIDGRGNLDVASAKPDGEGRFVFEDVELDGDFTYAVTASYHDILYSARLDPIGLAEPVELVIYEATDSIIALGVEADVLLIRRADGDDRSLSAFQVIRLENEGDRSFIADLERPGSMNFLRFSLPSGATELQVSSDLPGGDIITVGSGFALTATVVPGSHQVTYSYRIPYEGNQLELARSFPMGAKTFRLLIEDGLGEFRVPDFLTPLPMADAEGKAYRVWGATQLNAGDRLSVEMSGLPQPAPLRRLGDALTDGPYLQVGIPAALGLVLVGLLMYALALGRARRGPAPALAGDGMGTESLANAAHPPEWSLQSERRALAEAIAGLDEDFEQGNITGTEYQERREALKAQLRGMALTSEGA